MLASRRSAAVLRAPAAAARPPASSSWRRLSLVAPSSAAAASCPLGARQQPRRPPARRLPSCSRQCCADHAPPEAQAAAAATTATARPAGETGETGETGKAPPDHRDLGVQQELFTTSVYSPGSPIFLPNGARIFNRLVDFLRKQYVRYGFQEVITPTIYKKALWARSGHLDNYADDMFTVTSASLATGERRVDAAEASGASSPGAPEALEDQYGLKPMNCPGHCLIFAAQRRSYRDLPIRYADFSPLHRDELSGALSGLTRVRRFHQDDGHIFCRPAQVEAEIRATLDFVRFTYDVLGLGPYRLVLSTRPTDGHLIGSPADWDAAEDALRRALDASGRPWTVNPGDGAFYGPKIDIVLRDSDGKEHQTATVQLDFQLPRRFDLSYLAPAPARERQGLVPGDAAVGADAAGAADVVDAVDAVNAVNAVNGSDAEAGPVTPVLIHRAVLGSVERLMALLIEHYNGRWPFWLNPRQVMVLTVNDSDAVVGFAKHVQSVLAGTSSSHADGHVLPLVSSPTLLAAVDVDASPRTLPLKVREAKSKGYGAIVVVGPKDVAKGTVAVDLSGIPARRDDSVDAADADKKPLRRSAAVEMTPEALLRLLQDKVHAYQ